VTVAVMFFERAYGLNGQKRMEHDTLKQEMMALTGCSERAVHAVLYGSSYTDLLGSLRAQIPGYVAQKTSEMEDFTSLPFYHFDGNTAISLQSDAVVAASPSPTAPLLATPALLASPSSVSSPLLPSPSSALLASHVASPSALLASSAFSQLSAPSQPFQAVFVPVGAVTLPDGSNLSMDEAVSKHYPALFLLALVAILPFTLLY